MKKTHEFGIKLSNTVAEAYAIDNKNSKTLWEDDIVEDMKNINIYFDIMPDGESISNSYKQICCHMMFDMKMEDSRYKGILVAGGHMTKMTKCQTYSSVVSCETVRITLNIDALNDLQVKSGDVICRNLL